jgi:hypothetical protein
MANDGILSANEEHHRLDMHVRGGRFQVQERRIDSAQPPHQHSSVGHQSASERCPPQRVGKLREHASVISGFVHPDFGGDVTPGGAQGYGFPYAVVDSTVTKRAVQFQYGDESDGVNHITGASVPFYPIPDEAIGNAIHAVVTIADSQSLDATKLKHHCAEKLPAYMVPEKIEFRDSLPRTDNGKIDRRRLVGEMTPATK